MSGISTSLGIQDKITGPLQKIMNALDQTVATFEDVNKASNKALDAKALSGVHNAISQANAAIREMDGDLQKADASQQKLNKSVEQGNTGMNGLVSGVAKLAATYATIKTVGAIVSLSDEMVSTKARLDSMNDGLQTTEELQQKIYEAAQRSRVGYMGMADVVAKLGNQAGKAFKSNDELIAFSETLNKMFTASGLDTTGIESTMYNLTQSLSSGALMGQDYRILKQNAPKMIQILEEFYGVSRTELDDMVSKGEVAAEDIKNAMLKSSGDINGMFNDMPMTFGQAMTKLKNNAIMSFQPILNKINEMVNSERFQQATNAVIQGFSIIAQVTIPILDGIAWAVNVVADNMDWLAPILLSVAAAWAVVSVAQAVATAAQWAYNAALDACPITWIILAVVAIIAAVIALAAYIAETTGMANSAIGAVCGVLATAGAFIWNLFVALVDLVLGCVNNIARPWIAFANFFANIFNDPVASIIHLFGDMADNILGILESIASAIDAVFGSDLAGAVSGWREGLAGMVEDLAAEHGNGSYEKIMEGLDLNAASVGLERLDYGEAFDAGATFGDGLAESFGSGFDGAGGFGSSTFDAIANNTADTANSTGKMADAIDVSNENMAYLRDIAEQEAINRFTTAEIKVDMTNNNTVNSGMDIDGMISHLASGVSEAMAAAAEGVYV